MRPHLPTLLFAATALTLPAQTTQSATPHLERRGPTTQIIVDAKPFVMLSGELLNSSSSSLDYMKPIWPRLAADGLNTVITPLSWELIEPSEGTFDFALVDGLLAQARENHERIVFLWLAAWKNGVSSYPPLWVKRDTRRFPRVIENGNEINTLSTLAELSNATRDADARAFTALMQHIRQIDSDHTVLMMQVENEVGVLGAARDHSPAADRAFGGPVPAALTAYLKAHRDALDPELTTLWQGNGERTSGTWTEVFGNSARADEIFMAWNYALYVHTVAARGKAAYALPMYVNTWLAGRDTTPGDYPSGGPQPRVIDIWRAAGASLPSGPGLDLYAPDLYAADFSGFARRYHRDGNPLFLPETNGGEAGAANVFYALGEHAALGFSPFAIDVALDADTTLAPSYKALAEVAPLLLAAQATGSATEPNSHGFVLDNNHPSVDFTMQGNTVHISLDEIFGHKTEKGFGLIFATGPDTYVGVGKGFRVLINPRNNTSGKQDHIGLSTVDEGHFADGDWQPGRRLNGDETDQGSYWRFSPRAITIEKATFYHYE